MIELGPWQVRDIVRLLVISGVFVLAAGWLFQRSAPSVRAFAAGAAVTLLLLPGLLAWDPIFAVGIDPIDWLPLDWQIPAWVMITVFGVGIIGVTRELVHHRRQVRCIRDLAPVLDPHVAQLIEQARVRLGIKHPVAARLAPAGAAGAPCAATIPGNVVILPANFATQDEQSLRAVLVHELVHVRRRDDRWCLLMRCVVCFYWFLPWLRDLEQRFLDSVENSCDDRAADFFNQSVDYLSGVTGFARGALATQPNIDSPSSANSAQPSSAAFGAAPSHPLLQRVVRFAQCRDLDLDSARVGGWLLLTLVFGSFVTSVALVGPTRSLAHSANATPLHQLPIEPAGTRPRVFVQPARLVGGAGSVPSAREQVLPIYPGPALLKGLEGDVVVRYRIAADGSIVGAQIVHSDPQGAFDRATLNALRASRYQGIAHRPSRPVLTSANQIVQPLLVQQRFRFRVY